VSYDIYNELTENAPSVCATKI